MQGVILAAGMGRRLGAASEGLPKCLLRFGGVPLVEWTLRALRAVGADSVLVVGGYQADEVRRVVGSSAETAVNECYAGTNNLASFLLAEPWVDSDVVVANADVLFHPRILERLIDAGPDHVAFDSSSATRDEAMKVRLREGRVDAFSKCLAPEVSAGESVGIVHLAKTTAERAFARGRAIHESGARAAYLGEALAPLGLRGIDVAGLPWTDIDSPADLERARSVVWPELPAAGS